MAHAQKFMTLLCKYQMSTGFSPVHGEMQLFSHTFSPKTSFMMYKYWTTKYKSMSSWRSKEEAVFEFCWKW